MVHKYDQTIEKLKLLSQSDRHTLLASYNIDWQQDIQKYKAVINSQAVYSKYPENAMNFVFDVFQTSNFGEFEKQLNQLLLKPEYNSKSDDVVVDY
jgi:hypothetical protein